MYRKILYTATFKESQKYNVKLQVGIGSSMESQIKYVTSLSSALIQKTYRTWKRKQHEYSIRFQWSHSGLLQKLSRSLSTSLVGSPNMGQSPITAVLAKACKCRMNSRNMDSQSLPDAGLGIAVLQPQQMMERAIFNLQVNTARQFRLR